jgi:predicted O-linked N-acetylglucosamine transferase (SPINDLY family)
MSDTFLARAIDAVATLIERGDFAGAERRAQTALQNGPPHAEVWRLLAIAQLKTGKRDAALRSLEAARRLDPRSVDVLCNLGTVLAMSGRLDDAQVALQQALLIVPDHPAALTSLGRLLYARGEFESAAHCFERSLAAGVPAGEALINLANTRIAQRRWSEAEADLQRSLAFDPQSADGWYLLGFLHERRGELREAIAPYEKSMALQARPRTAHNLGLVFDQLGDWQAAARMMQRALQLDPNLLEAVAQLAFSKRRLCDWSGLDSLGTQMRRAVDEGAGGVTPFSFLAEDATPRQQLRCGRLFARQFAGASRPGTAAMSRADGMLRVGFVSSGFNRHATGLLIVELIEQLRTQPLRTIAFATTASDGTPMRERLIAAFDEFHDVTLRAPADVAARVRAAAVDVLIDLDGYCMGSLPQLFALRPASLQINWLAYPGSLGAPWYDYLIADRYLIPGALRANYDEKIAWLPRCYQPTDTTRVVGAAASREACGLPTSGFIYCCFNNTWKITPARFSQWMHILAAVPDSVLWLLDGPPGNAIAERLRTAARAHGIATERLVFSPKVEHGEYLARLRRADLFLDTNPYNAHTTASDALYAGCPVLTRSGETFASRVAGSINEQLGLDELIARDDDEYVRIAIELAQQPQRLEALRSRIADPATRARLFDMRAYAHDFAALLLHIAERARRGEPPQDVSV